MSEKTSKQMRRAVKKEFLKWQEEAGEYKKFLLGLPLFTRISIGIKLILRKEWAV